eukprot:SAG31_NODE_6043_length_2194_cov_5.787112_3_plen_86_part_00
MLVQAFHQVKEYLKLHTRECREAPRDTFFAALRSVKAANMRAYFRKCGYPIDGVSTLDETMAAAAAMAAAAVTVQCCISEFQNSD